MLADYTTSTSIIIKVLLSTILKDYRLVITMLVDRDVNIKTNLHMMVCMWPGQTNGEFNNASVRGRSLFWYLSLFVGIGSARERSHR